MNLLKTLADLIFPPRADEFFVRSLTATIVSACVRPVLIADARPATIALVPFHDERVRALVHEAKYFDSKRAQELLAAALCEYLVELGTDSFDAHVLIPLSRRRMRERGFNQCERIGRLALADTGLSLGTGLLYRTRETEHQARLGRRERAENVKGAFAASTELESGITYVLFDDVVTTGATMQAGIDAH